MRKRVAIVGSRDYPRPEAVRAFVRDILRHHPDATVVSGAARGVDTWAVDEARRVGLATEEFPADWNRHGRRAGFLRNVEMLDTVDAVVAFWDGVSRGTKHSIDYARCKGLKVKVVGA